MSASELPEAGAHDGGGSPSAVGDPQPSAPLFSVTKGNPTPEEVAALTAVIAAAAGGGAGGEEGPAVPTRRERIRQAALRPAQRISQRRGRL